MPASGLKETTGMLKISLLGYVKFMISVFISENYYCLVSYENVLLPLK
jgi:hypothetical protein